MLDTQRIEKKRRRLPRYIGPGLIVMAILAGAYFFFPGVRQLFRSPPAIVEPLAARNITTPEESVILESRSFQYSSKPVPKKINTPIPPRSHNY